MEKKNYLKPLHAYNISFYHLIGFQNIMDSLKVSAG